VKVIYEAEASATGGRGGSVRSSDGVLDLGLAVPKEMGGPGGAATNPEQLLAAGYAACFASALQSVARTRKLQLGASSVTARVGIGRLEDGRFRLAVTLLASLPDLGGDEADALVEEAHRICPYSNATRGDAAVSVHLVGADGVERAVA
jgi:lipoyl-dependent peroxiredoxin